MKEGPSTQHHPDREARDRLITAIDDFLNHKTRSSELSRAIRQAEENSSDAVVEHVGRALWHLYDDARNHSADLSKTEWDHCQRLLLLLHSDAVAEVTVVIRWRITQMLAAGSIGVLLFSVNSIGLWVLFPPFSAPWVVVSIGIKWWIDKKHQSRGSTGDLSPFDSMSELVRTRRSVASFSKKTYLGKKKGDAWFRGVSVVWFYILWILFWPLVMLVQSFPRVEESIRLSSSQDPGIPAQSD